MQIAFDAQHFFTAFGIIFLLFSAYSFFEFLVNRSEFDLFERTVFALRLAAMSSLSAGFTSFLAGYDLVRSGLFHQLLPQYLGKNIEFATFFLIAAELVFVSRYISNSVATRLREDRIRISPLHSLFAIGITVFIFIFLREA